MAIITVKSDDASITRTGSWSGAGIDTNQFSTARYFLACTGTATPSGTYRLRVDGLTAGVAYLLAFTLDALANRQSDQPIRIFDSDGTTILGSLTVNGQVAFNDFTYTTGASQGSPKWTWLGRFTPAGTSLTVYTDNSGSDASKFAIVDAVYCQLTTDSYTPIYTTRRSGNWSDTATWWTGDIPATNTAVTLSNAVTLTISANLSQGPSGVAGTAAITIGPGSSLAIADGVTFKARGDVILNQTGTSRTTNYFPLQIGTGTGGGGAILEFDGSLAASPSTASYVVGPTGSGQPNSWVKIRGTTGNRAKVRSNAGGANGRFSRRDNYSNSNGGIMMFDAQDCDFSNLGDNGSTHTAGFPRRAIDSVLRIATDSFSFTRCSFDTCYGGDETGIDAIARCDVAGAEPTINLTDVTFNNNLSTCLANLYLSASALPGSVTIQRSDFDKKTWYILGANYGTTTLQSNIYRHNIWYGNSASSSPLVDDGHLFYMRGVNDGVSSYLCSGNMTNIYFLSDKTDTPSAGNPHYVAPTGPCVLTGAIFDYIGPAGVDVGDCFNVGDTSGDCTIRNAIVLPSTGSSRTSGAIWRIGAGSPTLTFENNTMYCSDIGTSGLSLGHVSTGHLANSVPFARSNIWWANTASVTGVNTSTGASLIENYITPSGITHNAMFGMATGTDNIIGGVSGQSIVGMKNMKLSVAPAAPALTSDPQFLDTTRSFLEYGRRVLGLSGTNDAVRDAVIAAMAVDKTLIKSGLYTWVRAGFAPRNIDYRNASHTGLTSIGAVEYVATVAAVTARPLNPGMRMGGR